MPTLHGAWCSGLLWQHRRWPRPPGRLPRLPPLGSKHAWPDFPDFKIRFIKSPPHKPGVTAPWTSERLGLRTVSGVSNHCQLPFRCLATAVHAACSIVPRRLFSLTRRTPKENSGGRLRGQILGVCLFNYLHPGGGPAHAIRASSSASAAAPQHRLGQIEPQCHPSFRLDFSTLIPVDSSELARSSGILKMAFFKRELSPVERFESMLRDRRAARQKQADRVSLVETAVEEKRAAAERLAVTGATDAKLGRAETRLRAVEERAKALRAELAEVDEQIASTERAVADAKAQRDRDMAADQIEEMAAAIERAVPAFGTSAAAFVDAVTKSPTAVPEATRFSTSVDAVRREVLAAADLICWQLRSAAVRTRAGNANIAVDAAAELEQLPAEEIDRQLIYTLNALLWREGGEVRRATGVRAGRAAKNLVAGRAAASACGPSECPACTDPDSHSWQRRGPQRAQSRRSAAHRSRCACRRGRQRPGSCCINTRRTGRALPRYR